MLFISIRTNHGFVRWEMCKEIFSLICLDFCCLLSCLQHAHRLSATQSALQRAKSTNADWLSWDKSFMWCNSSEVCNFGMKGRHWIEDDDFMVIFCKARKRKMVCHFWELWKHKPLKYKFLAEKKKTQNKPEKIWVILEL